MSQACWSQSWGRSAPSSSGICGEVSFQGMWPGRPWRMGPGSQLQVARGIWGSRGGTGEGRPSSCGPQMPSTQRGTPFSSGGHLAGHGAEWADSHSQSGWGGVSWLGRCTWWEGGQGWQQKGCEGAWRPWAQPLPLPLPLPLPGRAGLLRTEPWTKASHTGAGASEPPGYTGGGETHSAFEAQV